jgi:hypothetical protein
MSDAPELSTRFPILAALRANGPHPDLADQLMTFGRFVGTWRLSVEFYDNAGECVYQDGGEWSFAWVLDGRAIQDVLTYPTTGSIRTTRGIGTTLRFYDQQADNWKVIWLGAVTGITVILSGGQVGEDIVLEGPDPDGTLNRWTFTNITTNSFLWTGLESRDQRASWRLRQRMTATRISGSNKPQQRSPHS